MTKVKYINARRDLFMEAFWYFLVYTYTYIYIYIYIYIENFKHLH